MPDRTKTADMIERALLAVNKEWMVAPGECRIVAERLAFLVDDDSLAARALDMRSATMKYFEQQSDPVKREEAKDEG